MRTQTRSKKQGATMWAVGLLSMIASVHFAAPAVAGEFTVGVVNFTVAIEETERDGALKKLEKDYEKREKKLKEMEKSIKEMKVELEENQNLFSEEKLQEKVIAYQKKVVEFRETAMAYEQEFGKARNDALGALTQVMQQIAVEIAQEKKLDLMLEQNEGAVLYFQNSADYTPELIRRYKALKK